MAECCSATELFQLRRSQPGYVFRNAHIFAIQSINSGAGQTMPQKFRHRFPRSGPHDMVISTQSQACCKTTSDNRWNRREGNVFQTDARRGKLKLNLLLKLSPMHSVFLRDCRVHRAPLPLKSLSSNQGIASQSLSKSAAVAAVTPQLPQWIATATLMLRWVCRTDHVIAPAALPQISFLPCRRTVARCRAVAVPHPRVVLHAACCVAAALAP